MKYKYHDLANIFPMMPMPDIQRLSDDIKTNGLKNRIVLLDDKIIDGRNRYEACLLAKIEPTFCTYKGADPLAFVLSQNLHRRHLDESQRAMIAANISNIKNGGDRKSNQSANSHSDISLQNAADKLNVSRRTVADAKLIQREAPHMVKKIESGEISINEVKKEIIKNAKVKEIKTNAKKELPSNIKLLYGDVFDMLENVPEKSIDCLFTDPPYHVMTDYTWDKKDMSFLSNWLSVVKSKLKDKYTGFIFCDARMQYEFETVIKKEFDIKNRVIWIRKNMAMGRVIKDRFISSYEVVFYFGTKNLNLPEVWGAERFDSQEFAVPQSNFDDTKYHPTQKPIALIQQLLSVGSFDCDNILDPFAGSGTTGVAAINLHNRNCTLIEKEKEYVDIIRGRINGVE